ncbi:MAG: FAD-dependent oxidoreductase [Planctomycetaceae bacterium]
MRSCSTSFLAGLLLIAFGTQTALHADDAPTTYDVVVYGGTSAGVIAAAQAKRMGKTAVVVGPDVHLGGLSSGGLGYTDSGRKETIGGLSRDFYHRLYEHYQQPGAWKWQSRERFGNRGQGTPALDGENRTMWLFEPHVAEAAFEQFVKEYEIPVVRNEWLDRKAGVKKDGERITSITMLSGKTYRGKMFIDATYEGDLMAAAGVTYTVGRESNETYGETLGGVQAARAVSHQFEKPVDPYVVPGDKSSGLLPRIHDGDPGRDGEADHRIQAYCYRLCMTDVAENRVPFPKPSNYDPQQYELLARYLDAGWRGVWNKFDRIPNGKTDTNNHGAFSTDDIGMNYDYPEASDDERKAILKEHENYQKGLLWFLSNDPRAPEDVRRRMQPWGLAKDEFVDNGNWPHQIYVREARRMVSDYVQTEQDCRRLRICDDSVGLGSYNMDSHNVQRYVDENGHARNEGDIQISPGGSYAVSYRSIVPKKGEAENLFVPVCLSSSHIAYGSIRMEPVFMILGQSAATAASLAIDAGVAVQDVPYAALKERLVADGQALVPQGNPHAPKGIAVKTLKGVVVDDEEATFIGPWQTGRTIGPWVGTGYHHDGNSGQGEKSVNYKAKLAPGKYEVRLSYSPNGNRATNVPVVVHHAEGEKQVTVNQKKKPALDGAFVSLGTFTFHDTGIVEIRTIEADGHVIADAVQFVPVE